MVRLKTDDELRSIISGYIWYGINEVIVDLEISQRSFSKFPLSDNQIRKCKRCDTDDADDSIFGTFDRYNDVYTDENDSTDDNSKDGSEDDAEDNTKQDSPNIHDSHGIVTETEKIGILLAEIPAHHKRSEAS
ncbi:hypothetical protein BGZ49_004416, partial [Haplosporangium sp. Z 27]